VPAASAPAAAPQAQTTMTEAIATMSIRTVHLSILGTSWICSGPYRWGAAPASGWALDLIKG
jgi:hypothetical protein